VSHPLKEAVFNDLQVIRRFPGAQSSNSAATDLHAKRAAWNPRCFTFYARLIRSCLNSREGEPALSPSPESCPALVLNADFRPLSYFPLSLWSWQDTVKAVFLDRVSILSEYDREVHSPSMKMRLPSVIALKEYIAASRYPAFTRFNVFLRDSFSCQYCGYRRPTPDLTFDHVVPKSKGGRTIWENVVTACCTCNLRKGSRLPRE